ncbi:MAG: DMT family transporter [Candidatus Pristimantibacillus sp.]
MARSLYFALVLLSLIWGGSFLFIKLLLHDFGPWTIAFLRSTFGLITIVVIMLIKREPFGWKSIPWIPMIIVALVNTAIPWGLIPFSETRLSSGMASVLNATTPLWTIIVGVLFFRMATNRLQWLGMGLAFIGLLILLGVNTDSIISIDVLGFVCMIGATWCYAVGAQLSKHLLSGLSLYQITFGTLFCTTIASGGAAFSLEDISFMPLASLTNLVSLIGLGVFGSGIAYILFYFMVQKGSAEFATTVTYLVPASAIIWGFTLLDEPLHWNLLIGLVIILSGVFLTSRRMVGSKRAAVK